jgi:hypothetical protein
LVKSFEIGHKELHNRHSKGRKELKDFLYKSDKGECIRKLFAPIIGLNSNTSGSIKDCNQLNEDGYFCMPCSNCSDKKEFWSTVDYSRKMGWHEKSEEIFEWPSHKNIRKWKEKNDIKKIILEPTPKYDVDYLKNLNIDDKFKISNIEISDGEYIIELLTTDDRMIQLVKVNCNENMISLLDKLEDVNPGLSWTSMVHDSTRDGKFIVFQKET